VYEYVVITIVIQPTLQGSPRGVGALVCGEVDKGAGPEHRASAEVDLSDAVLPDVGQLSVLSKHL